MALGFSVKEFTTETQSTNNAFFSNDILELLLDFIVSFQMHCNLDCNTFRLRSGF